MDTSETTLREDNGCTLILKRGKIKQLSQLGA
jgi:hypothetical protein